MVKEVLICPQCKNRIKNNKETRCPRCNALLKQLVTCNGCGKCTTGKNVLITSEKC